MQLTSLFRDKISIRAINDDQSKTISKPSELLSTTLVPINGHTVAWVEIRPSKDYLFFYQEKVGREHFYIRSGRNKQKVKPDDIEYYLALQKAVR